MESTYQIKIQSMLEQWALWTSQQSGEVKGYPREVPFYRMMRGASVSAPAVADSVGEAVDGAVSRLCQVYPPEGEAIKLRYLEGNSHKTIGRALRVSETTAGDLIRAGERYIEGAIDPYGKI
jgi:DNA-directed RNA polymerase specialized sigma24 family protein